MKTKKSTVQVLKAARRLLVKGWTRNVYVRKTDEGVKYCAIGAMGRANGKTVKQLLGGGYYGQIGDARRFLNLAAATLAPDVKGSASTYENSSYDLGIETFNDSCTTVGPVLAAFDLAIDLAKIEEDV